MTPTTIEEAIAAAQGKKILTPSKFVMDCPCCGHKSVAYKLRFRVPLIPALRVIVDNPLPTPQIADHFSGAKCRYIGKYFSELKLWGLIEWNEDRWYLTEKGRNFLACQQSIPCYVWQRNKGQLPEYCTDGEMKFIYELDQKHPLDDKVAHERIRVLSC